ncbi:MAG: restriction endonuclease subunit S [Acinetobacter sp.]|uniref:restriction endonuclease subunit S n=1 Tax=Acinetobacter sp. TaxID=472 RepID=UPI003982B0E7
MEKQKCPELRFNGYSESWEIKELREICSYHTSSLTVNDARSKGQYKLYDANDCIGYTTENIQYSEYITIIKDGSGVGRVKVLPKETSFIATMGAITVKNQKDDLNFIYYQLQRIDFSKHILGATIPHVYFSSYGSDSYPIPCGKEQIAISRFLQNLDQSIALHEKKLTQTQNLKKAMLEKMFPKAGSTQPEIRLKGFSGEWDVDTIGNVLQEVFRPINLDNEAKYRLVTVKRRNGGIAERAILKGKDILVKSQFEVKAGDYVISKRQVVHGATGLVPYELDGSIVSNEYLVGQGTDKLNIEFFALLSTLPEMYKKFFLSSYGVDIEKLFFDVNDWKKREISLPCLAEQIQISKFFKQLDETLALQQQQLQTLKNLKQAFLEKMFV